MCLEWKRASTGAFAPSRELRISRAKRPRVRRDVPRPGWGWYPDCITSPRMRALMVSALVAGLFWTEAAGAEPMNLENSRPRWVHMAMEISPPNQPGRLDSIYTPGLPAWLEPMPGGLTRVTLARGLVERYLMASYEPKKSPYGWHIIKRTE